MEMLLTILFTLLMKTQGQLQSCFHYCKQVSDLSSMPRPDCNCSFYNFHGIRSIAPNINLVTPSIIKSGALYEPTNHTASKNSAMYKEGLSLYNLYSKHSAIQNESSPYFKNYNKSDLYISEDESSQHNVKFSHKFIRRDDYSQNETPSDKTTGSSLLLYLDIDLNNSDNTSRTKLAQLKNMFEKFQTAEKDLSDCINLHVYIFSKYINAVNQTTTNWGHQVDNKLSNFQELTEIENKCDRTASIIKQSIYQIEQSYPHKEKPTEHYDEQNVIENISSNQDIKTQNEPYVLIGNMTSNEMTESTIEYSAGKSENLMESGKTVMVNLTYEKTPTIIKTTTNSDLSTFNNETFFLNPENKLIEAVTNTKTTSRMDRIEYDKEDLEIPKIVTKETSNGSVISTVEGNEKISYTELNINALTNSDESTKPYSRETESTSPLKPGEQWIQSDFVEIRGSLYFLFGNKQIPARFIQQPDGNLNVAIDGYSLCEQILEENTTSFINMLCHCLQLEKCSHLPV